jgi:hypothetical protein
MYSIDSGLSGCIMPLGDFHSSCTNIDLTPYHSTDTYVPVMCKLTADCDSFSAYRPDVYNEVYLPANTIFKNLNNVRGILSYGSSPLNLMAAITDRESFDLTLQELGTIDHHVVAMQNKALIEKGIALAIQAANEANSFLLGEIGAKIIPTNLEDVPLLIGAPSVFKVVVYEFKSCSQLAGSYIKSCVAKTLQYTSSDLKLKDTELCEIKVDCLRTDGTSRVSTSTVYSNINEKAQAQAVQFLENCDGSIVIGNLDDQCANSHEATVKNKSGNGKTGKILRF